LACRISELLRDAGLAVVLGAGGSFKSQMKKADASGARFAVILGDAEVQSGQVSLKPLRSEGSQQLLPLAEAINEMR
jgi:histidyl-tRNA synthetase